MQREGLQCFYCGSRRSSYQLDMEKINDFNEDFIYYDFCFGHNPVCGSCLMSQRPARNYTCRNNDCDRRLCGHCANRKICCRCFGARKDAEKNRQTNEDDDGY